MSTPLTIERAKELLNESTSEKHLQQHALAVSAALGQMAVYFNEDVPYWQAVGYLHDYDYENYPDEHLQHTQQPLLDEGVDEISVRAILSHGYGICTDVEPLTNLEKSLYAVDELTGLISAAAKMRPNGIADIKESSVKKKFKDKKFAAKIDRQVILNGCEMLGIDLSELIDLCIQGMQPYAEELDLLGTAAK